VAAFLKECRGRCLPWLSRGSVVPFKVHSKGRYKRVIGDTLKSRDDARRETEVAIAIKSLNRMRDFGQAICSRVA
jgi:hypothetical protein